MPLDASQDLSIQPSKSTHAVDKIETSTMPQNALDIQLRTTSSNVGTLSNMASDTEDYTMKTYPEVLQIPSWTSPGPFMDLACD